MTVNGLCTRAECYACRQSRTAGGHPLVSLFSFLESFIMQVLSQRFCVLPSGQVTVLDGAKYRPSDLLDCVPLRRILKRLGLLRPAFDDPQWVNEFEVAVSDEPLANESGCEIYVWNDDYQQTWASPGADNAIRLLEKSFDLYQLVKSLPLETISHLTVTPVRRLIGGVAGVVLKELMPADEKAEPATPASALEPVSLSELDAMLADEAMPELTGLDADYLFSVVPELRSIEGFIDGLQADAEDCWEGHAVVLTHRDEILRQIAHYIGPRADTVNPVAGTQEAYDVAVKHFLGEHDNCDPRMTEYLEARKTPETLDRFRDAVYPAWRRQRAPAETAIRTGSIDV